MKRNLILLDFEQTVITDVFDGADILLQNIRNIQDLSIFNNAVLGLMSWAIHDWTPDETELFNDVRPFIETEDTRFDDRFILSMKDWVDLLFKHSGVKVERFEVNHIFTKEDMIFKIRKWWQELEFEHIFLIDDAVEDHLSISLNDGTMVSFLDVNKL